MEVHIHLRAVALEEQRLLTALHDACLGTVEEERLHRDALRHARRPVRPGGGRRGGRATDGAAREDDQQALRPALYISYGVSLT